MRGPMFSSIVLRKRRGVRFWKQILLNKYHTLHHFNLNGTICQDRISQETTLFPGRYILLNLTELSFINIFLNNITTLFTKNLFFFKKFSFNLNTHRLISLKSQ